MNYIKKLQAENAEKADQIAAYRLAMRELRNYLLSGKFSKDPTVQTRDVLYRLEQSVRFYRELTPEELSVYAESLPSGGH